MIKDDNQLLEAVMVFASNAHGDQKRKYSGEPYVRHLLRVMDICRSITSDVVIFTAAILHDILEDTHIDRKDLSYFLHSVFPAGKAEQIERLVVELTDVYVRANYPSMNRRARRFREAERLSAVSSDAQTIKYADIIDNACELDLMNDFAPVFLRECKAMLQTMMAGHPLLYQRAISTVDYQLKEYYRRLNIRAL